MSSTLRLLLRRSLLPTALVVLGAAGCASPSTSVGTGGDAAAPSGDLARPGADAASRVDLAGQPTPDLAGKPADLSGVVVDMAAPPDLVTPRDLAPPPPDLVIVGKAPGEACTVDGECASGKCLDVYAGNKYCVSPCKAAADCAGFVNLFCEALTPGSPAGYCVPRHPAHCASCARDADCGSLSERCFQAPGDIAPACHVDCELDNLNACPADYTCTALVDSGMNRKLCLPNLKVCLDALGGYCDRVALPQSCARDNPAGTCTGQRVCIANSKRFDKCGAAAPQFKAGCNVQDPAGCMLAVDPAALVTKANCGRCGNACAVGQDCCGGACIAVTTVQNCGACGVACANGQGCCGGACTRLDTITNCGACGNACPGQGVTSDALCAAGKCDMSCRGDNYDVDKNTNNGCEVPDVVPPGHTQQTAPSRGNKPCDDGPSTDSFGANVPSDARSHLPAVTGFSAPVGAAPDYWVVGADGGLFCVNDYDITFRTQGGGNAACYRLTVSTNKRSDAVTVTGSGVGTISCPSSCYAGGGNIYFIVEKICNLPTQENVTYTVSYHL